MSANMMAEGAPPTSVDSMREAMRIGGCLLANLPNDQLAVLHSVLVENYTKSADLTPEAEVMSEPKSNNRVTARAEKPELGDEKPETVSENKPQSPSITTELPIAERLFAKDDEPLQPLAEISQPKPPVVMPKKQPLEQLPTTIPPEALVMARVAPSDVEKPVLIDNFSSERPVPAATGSVVLTEPTERPVPSETQYDEPAETELLVEETPPQSYEAVTMAPDAPLEPAELIIDISSMPAEPETIVEAIAPQSVEETEAPFEAAQAPPEAVIFEVEDLIWEARQEIGLDELPEVLVEPEAVDIMAQSLVAAEPFEAPVEIAPIEPDFILETVVETAILAVFEAAEDIAETYVPTSFENPESPAPPQKEIAELSDEEIETYCEAVLVSRNLPADTETVARVVALVKEQLTEYAEEDNAEEQLADEGTHERKQDATLGQIVADDISDALRHVRFGRWLLQTAFSRQSAHQVAA